MKKISAIVVLILCMVHLNVSAQSYFDLNIQEFVGEEDALATYENINETGNGLSVSYSLGTLILNEDDLYPATYNLSIDKFGQHISDGEPAHTWLALLWMG